MIENLNSLGLETVFAVTMDKVFVAVTIDTHNM